MRLKLLFENQCYNCNSILDNFDPKYPNMCKSCINLAKKKISRIETDEINRREQQQDVQKNLISVSHQIPDRGHDQNLGTYGWVMGEPSPGRSF